MAAALRTAGSVLRDRSKLGCRCSRRRQGPCDGGDRGQLLSPTPSPQAPAWVLPGAAAYCPESCAWWDEDREGTGKGPFPGRVESGDVGHLRALGGLGEGHAVPPCQLDGRQQWLYFSES